MRRATSNVVVAGLLVLLLCSIFVQTRAIPIKVARVTEIFPEVAQIAVPSIIWGVLAIACWQAVTVITLRIVALVRRHEFGPSAYGLLRAIVGCLVVFGILVVAAFIALNVIGYGTPTVVLGLIGGGLAALIGASALALFLGTRPFRGHYPHARSTMLLARRP